MLRPRWHDAIIGLAIVGLLVVGLWALWWDDVLGALGIRSKEDPAIKVPTTPAPTIPGAQT